MFPVAAVIGAGASLLGGALGMKGQSDANASNARQAQLNRDFQERMSNTAWQRGVADMRAAGLNPALAYEKGGASSPSGSTAHMENVLAGAQSSAGGAVNSYLQAQQVQASTDATRAQAQKTRAEANQLQLESALRVASLVASNEATRVNSALAAQKTQTEKEETTNRRIAGEVQTRELMRRDIELGFQRMLTEANLRRLGYENDYLARTLDTRVSAAQAGLQSVLYGLPELRNRARAADTWLGRELMPYLSTGADAAGAFDRILRMVR